MSTDQALCLDPRFWAAPFRGVFRSELATGAWELLERDGWALSFFEAFEPWALAFADCE